MIDKIKMFEYKNNIKQSSNNKGQRKSKNNIETPIKNLVKKEYPKTTEKNNNYIKSNNNNDLNNSNSYTRQSIKRNSFLKNLKENININNPKKNRNTSIDKSNNIYSLFVKNLKLGIKNNEENNKNENIKKNKTKKKKMILGDFLNQFVNKTQSLEIQKNDNNNNNINNKEFVSNNSIKKSNQLVISKMTNMNIYIQGKKQKIIPQNNNEDKKEIIKYKKELEIKENKIKELSEIIEKQNKIYQENVKLKEEIEQLKNKLNHLENNNNKTTDKTKQEKIKNSINIENNKFNNLITYNINKNNNYNIIKSQINNLEDLKVTKSPEKEPKMPIVSIVPKVNNPQPQKKENEKINEKEINNKELNNKGEERAKKATRAFERFKRANRSIDLTNVDKGNILKSDKISDIAKMLEGHIGIEPNRKRDKSVEVIHKHENENNEEMVNLINNQPIVNKKKKKMNSFSFDG